MKQNIYNNFNKIEKNFIEAESRISLNNIETLNNISVDDILSFFEKKENKSTKELENMINLVKKNSDQEKIKKNLNDMETILYSKKISSGESFDYTELKQEDFTKEINSLCLNLTNEIMIEMEIPSIFKLGSNKFKSNPKSLKFKKDITDKLQKSYTIDSVFCAFTTFDGRCYVAWGCPTFTVEVFDLIQDKLVKSLSGLTQHIYITRHFFDKMKKKEKLYS